MSALIETPHTNCRPCTCSSGILNRSNRFSSSIFLLLLYSYLLPSTFSESFNSSILTVAAQRLKCLYLYGHIIHRPQHRFIAPRAELLWSVGVDLLRIRSLTFSIGLHFSTTSYYRPPASSIVDRYINGENQKITDTAHYPRSGSK